MWKKTYKLKGNIESVYASYKMGITYSFATFLLYDRNLQWHLLPVFTKTVLGIRVRKSISYDGAPLELMFNYFCRGKGIRA